MPEFPFEIAQGQLDAQLGVLILLLGLVLAACLLPVSPAPKPPTPTDDTTKTRRIP
jgi:hypothetical protein